MDKKYKYRVGFVRVGKSSSNIRYRKGVFYKEFNSLSEIAKFVHESKYQISYVCGLTNKERQIFINKITAMIIKQV